MGAANGCFFFTRFNQPSGKEPLEKATLAGNQMLGIINNILDMSRIQSGALKLSEGVIEVKNHIKEIGENGAILNVRVMCYNMFL